MTFSFLYIKGWLPNKTASLLWTGRSQPPPLKHRTKQKPKQFMTTSSTHDNLIYPICLYCPCFDHKNEFHGQGFLWCMLQALAIIITAIIIILFNKSFSVLLRKHHPSCRRIPIYQANILGQCQTGN